MNKLVQLSPSSRVSPHRACRQRDKGGRWALAAFSTLLLLQRHQAFDQERCHRKPRLNGLLKRFRRPKAPKYPHFVGSVFTWYVPQLSFFVQKEMSASKSPFRPDPLLVLEIQPHRWPSHLWFTDWFTRCDTSQTFLFERAGSRAVLRCGDGKYRRAECPTRDRHFPAVSMRQRNSHARLVQAAAPGHTGLILRA